jgi:hypothetical protein
MAVDDRGAVVLPGEGKTISFSVTTFSGNGVRFVYTEPEGAYSLVEFVAAPGAPGTPLHLHRATDEACATSWRAPSASRWATRLWS